VHGLNANQNRLHRLRAAAVNSSTPGGFLLVSRRGPGCASLCAPSGGSTRTSRWALIPDAPGSAPSANGRESPRTARNAHRRLHLSGSLSPNLLAPFLDAPQCVPALVHCRFARHTGIGRAGQDFASTAHIAGAAPTVSGHDMNWQVRAALGKG